MFLDIVLENSFWKPSNTKKVFYENMGFGKVFNENMGFGNTENTKNRDLIFIKQVLSVLETLRTQKMFSKIGTK